MLHSSTQNDLCVFRGLDNDMSAMADIQSVVQLTFSSAAWNHTSSLFGHFSHPSAIIFRAETIFFAWTEIGRQRRITLRGLCGRLTFQRRRGNPSWSMLRIRLDKILQQLSCLFDITRSCQDK